MGVETGSPFTVIPGFREAIQSVQEPRDVTLPSQRFKQLCAEIVLPLDRDDFLHPTERAFLLGVYGYLMTDGLIRPEQSQFGPTDLNPFLRRKLEGMELSLSPAFTAPYEEGARAMTPSLRTALIFAARRVAFITGDHLREYDLTDPFVQETLQVIDGYVRPEEFDQELRPPRNSINWAFDVYKARVGFPVNN